MNSIITMSVHILLNTPLWVLITIFAALSLYVIIYQKNKFLEWDEDIYKNTAEYQKSKIQVIGWIFVFLSIGIFGITVNPVLYYRARPWEVPYFETNQIMYARGILIQLIVFIAGVFLYQIIRICKRIKNKTGSMNNNTKIKAKNKTTGKTTIQFNGKEYKMSKRYAILLERCIAGDEKAQYELISEYYEGAKDLVPEICFYYTNLIASKEKDLGVLTELGDLYYNGDGIPQNKEKAIELYERAVELYDNPPEGLFIPEYPNYREELCKTIEEYKNS